MFYWVAACTLVWTTRMHKLTAVFHTHGGATVLADGCQGDCFTFATCPFVVGFVVCVWIFFLNLLGEGFKLANPRPAHFICECMDGVQLRSSSDLKCTIHDPDMYDCMAVWRKDMFHTTETNQEQKKYLRFPDIPQTDKIKYALVVVDV